MSKFKKKLGRRIMAVALSLAMIMSNMTVYANELSETSAVEAEESVVSTDEETVDKETGNGAAADVETETTVKASESEKSSESDDNDEEQEDVKESEVEEKGNDQTTETKSFLREDKEENVSDVDNKAALTSGEKVEFYGKNTSQKNKLTEIAPNVVFGSFNEAVTNSHGAQTSASNATMKFTVPGESSDVVDIDILTCTYNGGTSVKVTAKVAEEVQKVVMEVVGKMKTLNSQIRLQSLQYWELQAALK